MIMSFFDESYIKRVNYDKSGFGYYLLDLNGETKAISSEDYKKGEVKIINDDYLSTRVNTYYSGNIFRKSRYISSLRSLHSTYEKIPYWKNKLGKPIEKIMLIRYPKAFQADKKERLQRGLQILNNLGLASFRKNHELENGFDNDTLLTKETKKTIIEIKEVAKELKKEEEATFVVQSIIHKYSSVVSDNDLQEGINLSLNPGCDVSVQSLYVELYTYYLKLLELQKRKIEKESKNKEIKKIDETFNGEDIVKETVKTITSMAEYLGTSASVKVELDELVEKVYKNKSSSSDLTRLFDYFNKIKKEYEKAVVVNYNKQEFSELTEVNQKGSK